MRPAVSRDAPALAVLRHEFRTALDPLVEPEPGFHARCAAWMAERLPNAEVWRCWMAEDAAKGLEELSPIAPPEGGSVFNAS